MLTCPRCAAPLKALRYGPRAVWGCGKCGGCAGAFALIREAVTADRWMSLRRALVAARVPSSCPCPSCRHPMLATEVSGIEIETCRRCQLLWFDRGEAPEPRKPGEPSPEADEAAARFRIEPTAGHDIDPLEQVTAWRIVGLRFGLPIELEAPATSTMPWATVALTVILVAIGILTYGDPSWIARYGFLPDGSFRRYGITLWSYFFLHSGNLHLFGNAYFLLVFGDNVEEAAGRRRFLAMTFLGAAAGALFHALLDPRGDVTLVGASAGISTLLVYYALRFRQARIGWYVFNLPAWGYACVWVGFQILTAIRQASGMSHVSAFAHLGGAAVGVAFWIRERRMGAWTSSDEPPS